VIREPQVADTVVEKNKAKYERKRKWRTFRRALATTAISLVLCHAVYSTADARSFVGESKRNIDEAFAGGGYSANAQYETVVHWSDPHDNYYSAQVVAEIVDQADAKVVIDTGDTTYLGLHAESLFTKQIIKPFQELGVDYVYVSGNHDSDYTAEYMKKHGATVLDGQVVEVGGYNFIGDCDPFWDNVKPQNEKAVALRDETIDSGTKSLNETIAESEQKGQYIDFLVTHDPSLGGDQDVTPYDVIYHLSGHIHSNTIYRPLDGNDYLFTIDDASGSKRDGRDTLFGLGVGRPSTPISARVFYIERGGKAGERRVVKFCTVTINPDGTVEMDEQYLNSDTDFLKDTTKLAS